ncbi:MAG TPA: hypothetical protein VFN65_14590 [Solirubrobacteraceae bacterium]|jgi:hypothetical protein|nr:hypothetical protein [Solirubrobacteraceae bacterium]
MSNQTITYIVAAGCAAIALIAFTTLVLVPVLGSYRGIGARIGAFLLSLYMLAAFVGVGVVVGALIIVKWPVWF